MTYIVEVIETRAVTVLYEIRDCPSREKAEERAADGDTDGEEELTDPCLGEVLARTILGIVTGTATDVR